MLIHDYVLPLTKKHKRKSEQRRTRKTNESFELSLRVGLHSTDVVRSENRFIYFSKNCLSEFRFRNRRLFESDGVDPPVPTKCHQATTLELLCVDRPMMDD